MFKGASKPKKLLVLSGALLLLLEIVYLAAGNYFIQSEVFQKLVNNDPKELYLKFDSAYTLFPGLVSVKGFSIEGQSGTVFWKIKVDRARAFIDVSALPKRILKFPWVRAEGGSFEMKLGLARRPPKENPGNPRGPFRFLFKNLSVEHFKSALFHKYQVLAEMNLQGGFQLWPGREVQVYKGSQVKISNGTLDLLGLKILTNVEGHVSAAIENYFPDADPDPVIVDKSDAHINLKGTMNNPDFLNYYLVSIPWLFIPTANGEFKSDIRIQKGQLKEPSSASLNASNISAALGEYEASGKGSAEWTYSEEKKLAFLLRLNSFQGRKLKSTKTFLEGDNFALVAHTSDTSLRSIFSDASKLSASLMMPKASISDLSFLDDFIPATSKFSIKSGTAQLEAAFHVSAYKHAAPGKLKISAKRALFGVENVEVQGDMNLEATISDMETGTEVFQVNEAFVTLNNVTIPTQSSNFAPWSGELWFEKSFLRPRKKRIFEGRVRLNFQDARPVFSLLAPLSNVASWVSRMAAMKNIKGRADVVMGPQLVDLSNISLDSTDLDLKGRLRYFRKQQSLAALVKYGVFRVGIEIEDNKSAAKVIGATKWFQKREKSPDLPEEYRLQ